MSHEAVATVTIDLPRAQAWEKLQDISLAHHYVPGIIKTEIVSENTTGPGASRYVYRSAKSYIQETVEDWEEGHGFTIRLHRGQKPAPPFKRAWFIYRLEDASPTTTTFTATLRYELPGGALGHWAGGKMQPFVSKTIADVAASMKLYYETGVPTTPEALKAFKSTRR